MRHHVLTHLGVFLLGTLILAGCTSAVSDTTSGTFYAHTTLTLSPILQAEVVGDTDSQIDISSLSNGYVSVSVQNNSKLKFQIICGTTTYNYDLTGDGTWTTLPLTMGNGQYTFRIMQNTTGDRYAEVLSTEADVTLATSYEPYLRPNIYCSYDADSACVVKADQLCANATNEGDVLKAICTYIVDNISYDYDKAALLSDASGYIPDPDDTFSSGKGICFDYSSLTAAMLRSQGIPCKIITGYVAPNDVYHSWNMVYIDGTWTSVDIDVQARTWTRIDLCFEATGANSYVGDGTRYTDYRTY